MADTTKGKVSGAAATSKRERKANPLKDAIRKAGAAILSETKVSGQPYTYRRIFNGHGEVQLYLFNEDGSWQRFTNSGNGQLADLPKALSGSKV